MTDTLLLILLALTTVGAASILWFAESRRRRRVAQRLAALAGTAERPRKTLGPLLRTKRRDPAAILDWIIGREAPLAAPFPVSRVMALAIGAGSATAAYLLLHGFFGIALWLGVVAAVGAFLVVPRTVCAISLSKQRFLLLEQMPDALGLLVRAARSGLPVTEGVQVVAKECPHPTSDEFLKASDAITVGTPLEEALEHMAQRTGMAEYRFFVTAVNLQRETGGNLGETLDNLANTVRARKTLRLKAKALSSEARSSTYVLASLPFITVAMLMAFNPQYASRLFHTESGRSLLGLASILLTLGIGSMHMLMRRLG